MTHLEDANRITGHRDEKDIPFVATVLAINGDGMISYDNDSEELTKT